MGSSMSCVPQHNFRLSKSFIRRNSSRLFRRKNPQEGQEKSNSIINILSTVTPFKEMSPKDLRTIENIKWDPPFHYDPASGWKKSSINVKNFGRMIHSSKVCFRFPQCPDIHECFLDLFETHLHFVSNNTTGLTYQGTLPLKELTICNLQQNCNHSQPQEYAFQINGVSLNSIIVYCSNQEEMDMWFSLLKEHIEANGGTAIAPENYTRVRPNQDKTVEGGDDLRNSISREPIYEWEGSQRDSLGPITYVSKVLLQHLPCPQQSDRLLVMYPSTLIILSEESDGLFYKGKLPLNMITVTTPCQDVKPNTFMIEGKMINPIVVSCQDRPEFCNWIQHFKAADVPVVSPPPPVYDIIYTPTNTEAPEKFDGWSGNSHGRVESLKYSQSPGEPGSQNLQLPIREENPLSPGYAEPLCYNSSRPSSIETAQLGSRTNSVSSYTRPECDLRPVLLRYASAQHNSYVQPAESSQIYSTPYSALHRANPQQKNPLIKSNSWSTPQKSLNFPLNAPQRHSDMCALRQPLSPLYDEPCSPEIYSLAEARPVNWDELIQHRHHHQDLQLRHEPIQSQHYHQDLHLRHEPIQSQHHHQDLQLLPSSFKLQTPPMGRRCRRSLVLTSSQGHALGPDLEPPQSQAEQRAEAVSRLKLLPTPGQVREQIPLQLSSVRNTAQMPYDYSPGRHSYLEPTDPDDQEVDYDNIWEFDSETGMIQSVPGISTHWTGLDFEAQGLGPVATQPRWS
ncbi:probable pleckstrin homology domain-containing family N member 1 isoform X2 [Kryptolebias marmoratus]|uniref:probable pleckstrin homology domain-containing family N member 1 isoform X2 n=1 Tax=Kryptolebias marmoratus TaxID=37003 RepID=UPI0007F875C2|nr:probable pleckstrin homology domain-containing family N member 1 isoform X2 [Kryptolebias marmoratus]